MPFPQGVYRIKNRKSGTYFDASIQDKGVVHGWAGHQQNENQKWIVEERDGHFTIKNADGGQFAEVGQFASVDRPQDGCRVRISGNPTDWDIRQKDDGTHAILFHGTQLAVDLDMGRNENGTPISIWGWHGAEQQQWHFERVGDLPGGGGGYGGGYAAQPPQQQQYQQQQQQQQPPPVQVYSGAVAPGTYVVENAFSGTAADLAGAGTGEGTPITGWQCNRGGNQTWDLIPAQNGYYFKNSASGTYLGFDAEGVEGTKICGSSRPVEWQVNQADQGYTVHLASNNNIVLDLAGGGKADGVPICLYSNHSGANQQWKFTSP